MDRIYYRGLSLVTALVVMASAIYAASMVTVSAAPSDIQIWSGTPIYGPDGNTQIGVEWKFKDPKRGTVDISIVDEEKLRQVEKEMKEEDKRERQNDNDSDGNSDSDSEESEN